LNNQKVTRKANRQGLFVEDPDGRPKILSKVQTENRAEVSVWGSPVSNLYPDPKPHRSPRNTQVIWETSDLTEIKSNKALVSIGVCSACPVSMCFPTR
jgi:GTP cyclohydrolase FolE2